MSIVLAENVKPATETPHPEKSPAGLENPMTSPACTGARTGKVLTVEASGTSSGPRATVVRLVGVPRPTLNRIVVAGVAFVWKLHDVITPDVGTA